MHRRSKYLRGRAVTSYVSSGRVCDGHTLVTNERWVWELHRLRVAPIIVVGQ
jgi:hypothetical protein